MDGAPSPATRPCALPISGTTAEFWLNLQSLYEIRVAEQKSGKSIKALPTLKRLEHAPA
jgi:plasmid maintenance system antidote protein VapI